MVREYDIQQYGSDIKGIIETFGSLRTEGFFNKRVYQDNRIRLTDRVGDYIEVECRGLGNTYYPLDTRDLNNPFVLHILGLAMTLDENTI